MLIQDWLTLKVLKAKDNIALKLKNWDKIAYEKEWKKYIWTIIWYECDYDYEVNFLYKLNDSQLEKYYNLNKNAEEKFNEIKNDLKNIFNDIKFITAKFNFFWDILYIYFFSDNRIDFRPYLNELRSIIWVNFFLYQVWARDSIRINPESKNICWDCWWWLCCTKSLCKIPSVETNTIWLQNLQTQWIDKQKWVCGKLKCCLKYEENIYKEEIKKYPSVWDNIKNDNKEYYVVWANILSEDIFVKDENWFVNKITLSDYDKKW